jgi:hypothetical protein
MGMESIEELPKFTSKMIDKSHIFSSDGHKNKRDEVYRFSELKSSSSTAYLTVGVDKPYYLLHHLLPTFKRPNKVLRVITNAGHNYSLILLSDGVLTLIVILELYVPANIALSSI